MTERLALKVWGKGRGLMKSPSQAISLEKKGWRGCHLLVRDRALHSGCQGDLEYACALKAEFGQLPKLLVFCCLLIATSSLGCVL